jgi:hypothetical protein
MNFVVRSLPLFEFDKKQAKSLSKSKISMNFDKIRLVVTRDE